MLYGVEDFVGYKVNDKVELKCCCIKNIYYNEDTNFGIYEMCSDNNLGNSFTISGQFERKLTYDYTYCVVGQIGEYKGRKQIKVKASYPCLPESNDCKEKLLIEFTGKFSATFKFIEKFGGSSLDVFINDYSTVKKYYYDMEEPTYNYYKGKLLTFKKNEESFVKLCSLGISPAKSASILNAFGCDAGEKVMKNPYILMKNPINFSFQMCDKIAINKLNFKLNDFYRIKGGAIYALESYQNYGHCYSPKALLAPMIKDLLDIKLSYKEMVNLYHNSKTESEVVYEKYKETFKINVKELKEKIDRYNEEEEYENKICHLYTVFQLSNAKVSNIIEDMIKENELIEDKGNIYLVEVYEAELYLAERISKMTKYRKRYKREEVEAILDKIIKKEGYKLEDEQREACINFNLYDEGVFLLLGEAGTGKTFTLNLILRVEKELRKKHNKRNEVKMVAPTGKASKVASKATKRECRTIHIATMTEYLVGSTTVACDETSMVDVMLMTSLFKYVDNNSKLILIGDCGQIPSIGAGNILADLISSNKIKTATLRTPKRQAGMNGLIINSHRILTGHMIKSEPTTRDFFLLERNNEKSVREATLESVRRILKFSGYTLNDIQVLIPQRKGGLGVNYFNLLLQREFNKTYSKHEVLKNSFSIKFEDGKISNFDLYIKENDRIMNIKNDYNKVLYEKIGDKYVPIKDKRGVFNGEVGIVESIFYKGKICNIVVKYDDFYVFYNDATTIEHCYATTIHKSQGSSHRATILVVSESHTKMWSRNLLYTGVTRAGEFGVVVGDVETINNAIHNTKVSTRFTTLKERIEEECASA